MILDIYDNLSQKERISGNNLVYKNNFEAPPSKQISGICKTVHNHKKQKIQGNFMDTGIGKRRVQVLTKKLIYLMCKLVRIVYLIVNVSFYYFFFGKGLNWFSNIMLCSSSRWKSLSFLKIYHLKF